VRTLANIADPDCFQPGEVYNIAGSEYHDIKTVSDMILSQLGKDDRLVKYERREAHNTRDKKGDPCKAQSELGHQTRVKLAEGIPFTIAWQKETYGIG
jgi:dTDP-glucose 4,6-dehydratase